MRVHLEATLATAAHLVAPVLLARLDAYRADPPKSYALSALGAQQPIAFIVRAHVGTPPDGARIVISAKERAQLFPVFDGVLRVEPRDMLSSRLILEGSYTVPAGPVGTLADRTVLAGIAESSLRALLAELKDDLARATLRHETGSQRAV